MTIVTRDQTKLKTSVVLPKSIGAAGQPTVLWRDPFGEPMNSDRDASRRGIAKFFAARGYAFVIQEVRGRGGSAGTFLPFRNERDDALDTTRWITAQPWSNGSLGTIGGSYLGYTAIAGAIDNPAVKVVVADDPPADEQAVRAGGVLYTRTLDWLDFLERAELPTQAQEAAMANALRPPGADVTLLGHASAYWQEVMASDDPRIFPAEGSLNALAPKLCAPTFIVHAVQSRSFDPIRIWSLLQTQACPSARDAHRLYVVPEEGGHHVSRIAAERTVVNQAMLDFIDHHLGGKDTPVVAEAVHFRDDRITAYRASATWPPSSTTRAYYLENPGESSDGGLVDAPSVDPQSVETMDVDPATMDPCAATYPVTYYTGPELTSALAIAGTVKFELYVSAPTPDVDTFADLYEFTRDPLPDGTYTPVATAGMRARYRSGPTPTPLSRDAPTLLELESFPTTHTFSVGSQVVLEVHPGACSAFENPHTGEPITKQTKWLPSTLRVHHGPDRPSRVVLPLAP
jgi:predicted acyl esterase